MSAATFFGGGRRAFLRHIAALTSLPSTLGSASWALILSRDSGGQIVNGGGSRIFLPAIESHEQGILVMARALLAQQSLDQQTRLIEFPNAFLQRNLRLGYRSACQLADALEKMGDWSSPKNNCRTLCRADYLTLPSVRRSGVDAHSV